MTKTSNEPIGKQSMSMLVKLSDTDTKKQRKDRTPQSIYFADLLAMFQEAYDHDSKFWEEKIIPSHPLGFNIIQSIPSFDDIKKREALKTERQIKKGVVA